MANCPECGTEVGLGTNRSAYKHAISCLHLEDKGKEHYMKETENKNDVRNTKIRQLMQMDSGYTYSHAGD